VSTMERYLRQVVDEGEIAPEAQTRLYSLQQALPLMGHKLVERWREKAANYPPRLTHNMLAANLPFHGYWYAEEMLAARGDVLLLYRSFVAVGQQLIHALHGLNRRYLSTPDGIKWMDETLATMPLKPEDCAVRIKAAFQTVPVEGVRVLKALIAETLDLVELHVPDFNTAPYRANFSRHRQIWDGPPPAAVSE
jgi:hypothetical protein